MTVDELYYEAAECFKAKNFDAALTLVHKLQKISPNHKQARMIELCVWHERENCVREVAVLEKLLPQLDPSLPDEKSLRADALNFLGMNMSKLARPDEAVKFLRMSARLSKNNAAACTQISNALFVANASEKFSRADFAELYAEYKSYLSDVTPFVPKIHAHKKIRVGFLSADFGWHAVMAWSWALLTELDRNFFATCLYSSSTETDEVTEYLRTTCDLWRDISDMTDFDAAKLIREDEIDILFDLSGHTAGNRLRVAAFRPATVQISGVGYMNSTGLDCFDCFLSDVHCAGDESYFVEKVLRLPNSHVCYTPPPELEISEPPCLRKGFVTFGSFNNFAKITDTVLTAWKEILDRVPESRLLLKHKIFDTADDKQFVKQRLQTIVFDLRRDEMRGYSTNYLREYNDIDVALDTFPYTGGVTTCEALWLGVPVVSLYGNRHGTRFGLSMLTNVDLAELAVATVEEYVARAVMLANDSELLTLLRRNLREMMKNSPLMDATTYVRDVERVFKQILIRGR